MLHSRPHLLDIIGQQNRANRIRTSEIFVHFGGDRPFYSGREVAPSLIQTRNGHHLAAKGARVAVPAINGLSKLGLGAISVPNKSASCCRVQIHIGGSPCPSVFPAQDRASCLRPYSLKVARRGRAHQRCRHACRPENSAILI